MRRILSRPRDKEPTAAQKPSGSNVIGRIRRKNKPSAKAAASTAETATQKGGQPEDFPEIQAVVGTNVKKVKPDKLIKLVRLCEYVYDFRIEKHTGSRGKKLEALRFICSYVSEGSNRIDVNLYRALMRMIMANVFRELPRNQLSNDPRGWDWDEDKPKPELAWEHLERCYTLLHHILRRCTMDDNMAQFKVTFNFVSALMENFNSTDSRERYMVKLNIHQIYKSNTEMRKRILVYISNVFLRYVFEDESFLGVKEMLELLVPIINGMSYPLRKFNVSFLEAVLLPMHKCHYYTYFVSAHISCMRAYMIKDPAVAPKVLVAVLKYWPRCATKKEVFMLLALHDFIEVTKADYFSTVRKQVWSHLARCCNSLNEGIANCSMQFWNDAYFLELVSLSHDDAIRIFFPQIASAAFQHWSKDTREMARSLLQAFEDINPTLVAGLLDQLEKEKQKNESAKERTKAKWIQLEKMVKEGKTWKPGMKLVRSQSESSMKSQTSKPKSRTKASRTKDGSHKSRNRGTRSKDKAVQVESKAKSALLKLNESAVQSALAKVDSSANVSKSKGNLSHTPTHTPNTNTPEKDPGGHEQDKTQLMDVSAVGQTSHRTTHKSKSTHKAGHSEREGKKKSRKKTTGSKSKDKRTKHVNKDNKSASSRHSRRRHKTKNKK